VVALTKEGGDGGTSIQKLMTSSALRLTACSRGSLWHGGVTGKVSHLENQREGGHSGSSPKRGV
jgi:hypothetical protein